MSKIFAGIVGVGVIILVLHLLIGLGFLSWYFFVSGLWYIGTFVSALIVFLIGYIGLSFY